MGFGFGNFIRIFPYVPQNLVGDNFNYVDEKFTHAHNDFVEAFFELGYLGLICMTGLIGTFLWKVRRIHDRETALYFSCVCAWLLNATGNFLSQLACSGMLLILYYGMFRGSMRRENE